MSRIESIAHGRAYAYENALRGVTASPLSKILSHVSGNNRPDWLTLEEVRDAWQAYDDCRRVIPGRDHA